MELKKVSTFNLFPTILCTLFYRIFTLPEKKTKTLIIFFIATRKCISVQFFTSDLPKWKWKPSFPPIPFQENLPPWQIKNFVFNCDSQLIARKEKAEATTRAEANCRQTGNVSTTNTEEMNLITERIGSGHIQMFVMECSFVCYIESPSKLVLQT
jgi:hypothetical protein